MPTIALTRDVSPSIDRCELTHLSREKIDAKLAHSQHLGYLRRLEELGCRVQRLPADPELADSVFVEDTAIVLDDMAVITRPGAVSRRPETAAIQAALNPYRHLTHIFEPGMLDGGDVLVAGHTLYVGLSTRSNRPGIEQLSHLVEPHGFEVKPVEFHSCLHLKSAVTRVAERTLLIQSDWVDPQSFAGFELIHVHPEEPHGGNALQVNGAVLYPEGFDRTRERLETAGLEVHTVALSELAKAEGGVTCCSLIFEGEIS
jgi:dimethylargininase